MNVEKDMTVNYSAIDLLNGGVDKHHRGIETSMGTLTGRLDFMESSQDGEDREAYAVCGREWNRRELEIRSTLQQFNIEVFNTKLGYHGAEIQNRRTMGNVRIPKARGQIWQLTECENGAGTLGFPPHSL